MASDNIQGTPRITYTPPGGSQIVFLLAVPFSAANSFIPSSLRKRWDWWAADNKTREIVRVGSSVDELVCTIRYDNDPTGLKKMLTHGLEDNVTLNYQASSGGTSFPLKLVSVQGADDGKVTITPDKDKYGGEWEATIVVRRVDGGTLEELIEAGGHE